MSEIQIRAALADYLARRISLDLLEELVVVGSWDVQHGEAATELAATVSNLLAEFDADTFDEDTLREQLGTLSAPWVAGALASSTASSVKIVSSDAQLSWWQLAGRPREAEPA